MTELASTSANINDSTSHEVPKFRVYDNGRALWIVTAVLLLAGLGALRMLIGVSDTPRIEPTSTLNSEQQAPLFTPPENEVHRLRPQTSSDFPSVQPLGDAPTFDGSWPEQPTAAWELTPGLSEPGFVHPPEFLR